MVVGSTIDLSTNQGGYKQRERERVNGQRDRERVTGGKTDRESKRKKDWEIK